MMTVINGYLGISTGRVERTVEITTNIDVDVDVDGRIVGVETFGQVPDASVLIEVLRSARIPDGLKTKN